MTVSSSQHLLENLNLHLTLKHVLIYFTIEENSISISFPKVKTNSSVLKLAFEVSNKVLHNHCSIFHRSVLELFILNYVFHCAVSIDQ